MLSQLPEKVDPRRLCEQGKRYEGRVALRELARLTPLLASEEGEATFELAFDRDDAGRPRVTGRVCAELLVPCQRCLEALRLEVDAGFRLSPVEGLLEAERLPEPYEPLLLDERLLRPLDLVEDELILAVPAAPRHAPEACAVDLADWRAAPRDDGGETPEAHPFAVLRGFGRDD